jgi:hypothetical protein
MKGFHISEDNNLAGVNNMRKEASLEQWKELYDVAIRIKEMKPWEDLWDMDLITILPSEKEEPYVCNVMGRGGECFGIGAYIGFKAIHDLFLMTESKIPPNQLIRYQNNITCYFGDRKELIKKDLEIIKDLGFKFRGKNKWIYFRSFESGYVPYILDENQVLKFTEILKHLYMAIKALNNGISVDFEKGNTLVRRYDEKSKLWLNHQAPVFYPQVQYPIAILQDELLVQRANNQKSTNIKLEFDIAYLNSSIKDKNYDKPIATRICILADVKTNMVLDQFMIEPKDNEVKAVFDMAFNYIMQRGKPKTIIVRDTYI